MRGALARSLPFREGVSPSRMGWFARVFALAGLALFAATWRLWTPESVYPQVPLVPAGRLAPNWLDWIGLAVIALALATGLFAGPRLAIGRAGLLSFAVAAAGMIQLDQHRLQPWAHQFVLIAVVLATRTPSQSFFLLKWLTVAIYFWSSLGKFDHVFLHGAGQQFAATALGWVGVSLESLPPWLRLAAAGIFPTGELLVAVGLALRRTRRLGLIGACVMHLGLIAVLGPLGLDHQPAVLLWNAFFIAQAVFLFGSANRRNNGDATDPVGANAVMGASERRRWGLAEAFIALAILLPALEPWRLWDHWPSWALYSTRAERVTVLVHRLAAFRLPEDVATFLRDAAPGEDWRELEIDRWSLQRLGVPVYPQARFQLGVAEAVGRRYELGGFIQAIHEYPSNRWTGRRRSETFVGVDAIAAAASRSWLNGHPRPAGQSSWADGRK